MTLTPFRSEAGRRGGPARRPAQPDVTGYVDPDPVPEPDVTGYARPDPAVAERPAPLEDGPDAPVVTGDDGYDFPEADDLVVGDDADLWELEGRYAGPSADPTPSALPRPELAPGETTQTTHTTQTGPRPAPRRRPADRRAERRARQAPAVRRPPPAAARPGPPVGAPRPGRRRRRRPPPVMRLGVIWALVLGIAVGFAPDAAAVLLIPVTAIAAQSAWRRVGPPTPEPWWLAAVAAGVCPPVAVLGPVPALVAVAIAAAVVAVVTGRGGSPGEQIKLGLCVAAPAAGSASLIAACTISPTIGLVLFVAICLFDASNYVMGVGDTGGGLGAIAGLACLVILAIILAGVFVVPFHGNTPYILCGTIAVAAPLSTGLAHGFVGRVRLPAWRRLDSLFLAGPLYVGLAAALLPH